MSYTHYIPYIAGHIQYEVYCGMNDLQYKPLT